MQNQKSLARPWQFDCYPGGVLRRRVADCRERLRRDRAARRIAERATPHGEDLTAEVGAMALASASADGPGGET
ncbi:MAG TPA: hypothetical protein VGX48_04540 [Pyrinomonadaceae bacterium]|jgi:hypothetical protein|nr:hypothetical protein [Pyrinomonadaceae bacterium]